MLNIIISNLIVEEEEEDERLAEGLAHLGGQSGGIGRRLSVARIKSKRRSRRKKLRR
jgi:hypothetical protein